MRNRHQPSGDRGLARLFKGEQAGGLAALLGNLPGAVYCCRDDAQLTVEWVSSQVEPVTGYSTDALMQGRVTWRQLIHPDDRARVLHETKAAVGAGRPWLLEYRIRHADGRDRWVLDRGRGVSDETGLVCLQGFVSDVTDRREASQELRESEQRFRSTFENAAVGIAHIGLDGRWLRVNARLAEIVGYTPEELREKTFGDITYPDDLDADWAQVALLIAGQIPNYSMEKRYFRKDGSTVWCNLTVALVRKTTGEPDYFISVVEDIDLRKQAEQALEKRTAEAEERAAQLRALTSELIHAEDRERRRIAQVLHDHLQQLMVAAKFSLRLVHERLTDAELRDQLERARALLDDSISESRTLTSELSPQVLYTKGLIAALDWLAGWMREKHGLTVTVAHAQAKEPADEQTAVLLFQSIRELLFNVVKHAGVREATVTLEAVGGTLRAVVEDRGRGFEPSAADSPANGDGFGHFAVRERLALIGGRFEIVSKPGAGTRVTLEVPLQSDALPSSQGPRSRVDRSAADDRRGTA